jgi:hypothetical protein
MRVVERVVSNRFGRWMVRHDWAGFTAPLCPWLTVVFYWTIPGVPVSPRTRRHEHVHVMQIERYGWWGFLWRYLWELRKGYRNNALEREAYELERDPLPLRLV